MYLRRQSAGVFLQLSGTSKLVPYWSCIFTPYRWCIIVPYWPYIIVPYWP